MGCILGFHFKKCFTMGRIVYEHLMLYITCLNYLVFREQGCS